MLSTGLVSRISWPRFRGGVLPLHIYTCHHCPLARYRDVTASSILWSCPSVGSKVIGAQPVLRLHSGRRLSQSAWLCEVEVQISSAAARRPQAVSDDDLLPFVAFLSWLHCVVLIDSMR